MSGGRTADSVVRIGDTVHRTRGQNYEFSHAILNHLQIHNFKYSPRSLGIDAQGREILSFIEGEVPIGRELSLAQMIQCVKAMREFHDIASLSPLRLENETICHLDFVPWNVIFKNEDFASIIDFDDSRPGNRTDDLAYLIWTFLDLGVCELNDSLQISKIRELCAEYGLKECLHLNNALPDQQHRILRFRQKIVNTEEDEQKRNFSIKAIENITKSIAWVKANSRAISIQLLS